MIRVGCPKQEQTFLSIRKVSEAASRTASFHATLRDLGSSPTTSFAAGRSRAAGVAPVHHYSAKTLPSSGLSQWLPTDLPLADGRRCPLKSTESTIRLLQLAAAGCCRAIPEATRCGAGRRSKTKKTKIFTGDVTLQRSNEYADKPCPKSSNEAIHRSHPICCIPLGVDNLTIDCHHLSAPTELCPSTTLPLTTAIPSHA